MDELLFVLAFISGIFAQRIYSARWKGFTSLGESWSWSNNNAFRLLHRIYCELCPRRLSCERYKKEVAT